MAYLNLPLAAFLMAGAAQAAEVTFEWDPVADDRVALYELQYGLVSGNYEVGTTTEAETVTMSVPAGSYFAAVRACNADQSLCSAWSVELPFVVEDAIQAPASLRIGRQVN